MKKWWLIAESGAGPKTRLSQPSQASHARHWCLETSSWRHATADTRKHRAGDKPWAGTKADFRAVYKLLWKFRWMRATVCILICQSLMEHDSEHAHACRQMMDLTWFQEARSCLRTVQNALATLMGFCLSLMASVASYIHSNTTYK